MPDDTLPPDAIRAARDEVASPGVRPADTKTPGERPGDAIDRYKLLQEIGEGGMGTVWMAEQREPVVRKVALKIVKLGMDTREVVTRFEAERQALALMDHPSIAKVLDGGATATGRPFFVMELVKGAPITQFCDDARLGLRERLELFAKVCEAVQHAHHKGIIHRDLKPSNVLVTLQDGTPLPKVIDFGIAKAVGAELTQKTMFTRFAQVIGTPEYMAPEQAGMSALDVDTRADVYSLGVLLYELLTGTKPFEMTKVLEKGYDELLRTIREDDPERPSTRVSTLGDETTKIETRRHLAAGKLSGHLRGDLDWIVMKAIEKDRTRRYETTNGFALDVRRYLHGEPVLAAPPSASYRLRKFVARRKATVAAVAAIAMLLLAGSIGTGIGWYEANLANRDLGIAIIQKEEQRQLAEAAKTRAEQAQVAASIESERAKKAEAESKQRATELEQVSTFQEKQLAELDVPLMGSRLREALLAAAPEAGREDLAHDLAGVNFTSLALGSLEQNLFGRTIDAIDAQFAQQPAVQARLLQTLGVTLREIGLGRLAEDPLRRALAIQQRVSGEDHEATLSASNELAGWLGGQGRNDEAERLFRANFASLLRRLGPDHEQTLVAKLNLGFVMANQDNWVEGNQLLREVLPGLRQTDDPRVARMLATALNNIGALEKAAGRPAAGEPLIREALATCVRHAFDQDRFAHTVRLNLAGVLQDLDRVAEAETLLRQGIDGCRQRFGDRHGLTVSYLVDLGSLLTLQRQVGEAEVLLQEAHTSAQAALEESDPKRRSAAVALVWLLIQANRPAEAEPLLRTMLAATDWQSEHPTAEALSRMFDLANALKMLRKHAEAERLGRRALDIRRRDLGNDALPTLQGIKALADVLRNAGRLAEAEPLFREAVEGCRRVLGDDHRETVDCIHGLGSSLIRLGRAAEAEPLLQEALRQRRTRFGDGDPRTVPVAFDLADTLYALGRRVEMERLLGEQCTALRSRFGASDPVALEAAVRLASLQLEMGKLAAAEPLLREAVAHLPDPTVVPTTISCKAHDQWGHVLARRGKVEEAARHLRLALAGWRTMPDRRLNLRQTLDNLCPVLIRTREFGEAEVLARELLDLCPAGEPGPPLRAAAFSYLASALTESGRAPEALPFAEAFVADMRAAKPPRDDMLGDALARLAMLQFDLGTYAAAEATMVECLELRSRVLPAQDWRLRSARNYLGAARGKQGRWAEGEAMLVEGTEWMLTSRAMPSVALLGADRAGMAAQRVIDFYDAWHAADPKGGHDAKAAAWRSKLAEHQERRGK